MIEPIIGRKFDGILMGRGGLILLTPLDNMFDIEINKTLKFVLGWDRASGCFMPNSPYPVVMSGLRELQIRDIMEVIVASME